jgi:Leucine-rich repeat (LRR) protein
MKKNYFVLAALFLFCQANSQIVNIPDANFKAKLLQSNTGSIIAYNNTLGLIKIDANDNGEIELSEILKVDVLNIDNSNISDYTGIEKFSNLKNLNCSNNTATKINVSDLAYLQIFSCNNNKLTVLKAKNCKSLVDFTFENNPLVELDLSGCSSLPFLNCFTTTLTNLNVEGCISMYTLNCPDNLLTSLDVSTLSLLINFECSRNKLKTLLVNGAKNIAWISCDDNQLTDLDVSSLLNMHTLHCNNNNLKQLDVSNLSNLLELDCSHNQISVLKINKNLDNLNCSNNQLLDIDLSSSNKIRNLDCSHNKLSSIDGNALNSLEALGCSNNNLQSLFLKNGKYNYWLDFSNNPDINYICIDENEYEKTYFQGLINKYGYINCTLNSFCELGPGGNNYIIKGKITYDENTNGCDENDRSASNVKFLITDGVNYSGNAFSNTLGNYITYLKEGTYTLTPILENSKYYKVSPESIKVSFTNQNNQFIQDFCITPNGFYQDLEVTILPTTVARPGFDATYNVIYRNKGNQVQSGKITLDFNDSVLDYVSSVPENSSKSVNKLVWDYVDLQPFETKLITLILNVNSPMESPSVNIDDRLSFNALITPITNDEKPVDNSFALRQTVVGSYDPNDKTCLEGDVITPSLIGEYVHYLIRFENTGTYPAENIVVKDMIDLSKFDISTLMPTKASHSYATKISDGNKVEFIFEKINLPFDDANNDGYIAFKIKTLPTLSVGDSFENEANIYFDYNFPILTNKAVSSFKTLGTQDFEFSKYVTIYPIPVTSVLNISIEKTLSVQSMTICNILGQAVIVVPNAEKTESIDVSKLLSGNYFIKIISDKGVSSAKFIKI